MTERLVWDRDGRDWPNRSFSRFVRAAGFTWHVQQMGAGPGLLLIHGTGASTHSWRDLAPRLAKRYTVLSMDLPGHGFTDLPAAREQLSLTGMAAALGALVEVTGVDVRWVVGHSAGGAIGARMALDRRLAPLGLIGINAALLPLDGLSGLIFPPAARLMAATPLAARLFAWRAADPRSVERLIAGTGSTIDQRGVELYGRLVRDVKHVSAALGMMANWDLARLALGQLATPLTLVTGTADRAVPLAQARRAQSLAPAATLHVLEGAGHLAHEERPDAVAEIIESVTEKTTATR